LHVGSAYSIRDDRGGTVRFRGRPEWRDTTTIAALNSRFVDTGDLPASDYSLYQAEMAWVAGAFSFQTESLYAAVNSTNGRTEAFNGGYAMVSYFLTGESRPYDKRLGRFARLKPTENFFSPGVVPTSLVALVPSDGAHGKSLAAIHGQTSPLLTF
jgi:phosphate-selective porin OprO and OprP